MGEVEEKKDDQQGKINEGKTEEKDGDSKNRRDDVWNGATCCRCTVSATVLRRWNMQHLKKKKN